MNAEILDNEIAVDRSFDFFSDSRLQVFIDTLNIEMQKSAEKGLVGGLKKGLRKPVIPEYLKKVFKLPLGEGSFVSCACNCTFNAITRNTGRTGAGGEAELGEIQL